MNAKAPLVVSAFFIFIFFHFQPRFYFSYNTIYQVLIKITDDIFPLFLYKHAVYTLLFSNFASENDRYAFS